MEAQRQVSQRRKEVRLYPAREDPRLRDGGRRMVRAWWLDRWVVRKLRGEEADGRRARSQYRGDGHRQHVRRAIQTGGDRAATDDEDAQEASVRRVHRRERDDRSKGSVLAVRVYDAPRLADVLQPDRNALERGSRAVETRHA